MVVAALRTARQRPVARIQTPAADSLEAFVGGTDGRPAAALAERCRYRRHSRRTAEPREVGGTRLQPMRRTRPPVVCPIGNASDTVFRRPAPPQSTLPYARRKKNVAGLFRVAGDVKKRNLLLIDNVATTNATLAELSRMLKQAGAGNLYCWTLAQAKMQKS